MSFVDNHNGRSFLYAPPILKHLGCPHLQPQIINNVPNSKRARDAALGMVLGLTPLTSAKDGNCLYESFARACNNGHAVGVDQMRSRIVVATQSNAELCADIEACEGGDVAAYLARMSTNRTWGAEPEIQAFSDLYKVNMRIYGFSPRVKVIVGRCFFGGCRVGNQQYT